jgi:hypothetical protein
MSSRKSTKTAWSVKVLFLTALMIGSLPASAAELAALVMAAAGVNPELARDSLVSPGQSFDLGADGKVTLAYLSSCVVERIEGGRFTVGSDQSEVTDGKVERSASDCLAAGTTIETGPDAESGGAYSRDPFAPREVKATQPIIMIPGIARDRRVHFVIERIDTKTTSLVLDSEGPVLDLMRVERALALGGKYKVEADGRTATFTVIGEPPPAGASTSERIVVMQ